MYFPFFVGVLCLSLFCYALRFVHSSFAIILKRKRELITLLLLSFGCLVTVNVPWLFPPLPWVGLQCVIVVYSYSRTLTLPILKTIINLQTFSVHSYHHRHKGQYTGELHCLHLHPRKQPYLIRSREYFDACGMMVFVSIPVCWTW